MSINLLNVFECVCLFLEIQRHIVCYNIKVLVHVSITKKSFAIKFVADPSTKPAFVCNKAKRVLQEKRHVKFSKKRTYLTHGLIKVRFSKNLTCFVFF